MEDMDMDGGMVQNPDEIIDILTKPNFDDNDNHRDTTRTNFEITVRKYTGDTEYEMGFDYGPNNINCQSNQESDLKPFKIHQNRGENFENIDIKESEQTHNTIDSSNEPEMVLDYKIDIREEESAGGESYLVAKTNHNNVNLSSIQQNSKIISSRNTQSTSRREKKNLKRKICHRCWKSIVLNSSTRHICTIDNDSTQPTYACTLCPNKYFYRDSVRRHLRNNHQKEISGVKAKDYANFFIVLSENKSSTSTSSSMRMRKSKNKIRVEIEQGDENKEVFQSQVHSQVDEDPLNFIICALCANCIDGKDYEEHLKVVHKIGKMDESKRICDRCREVIDLNSLYEHICKIRNTDESTKELTNSNYACKLCHSKYHNRNSVRRHLLNNHKKIMSCVENISDFIIFTSINNQKSSEGSNSTTVQTRMTSKSKYSNSSPKICSICAEICIDRRDHLDHLKNAHGIDIEGNFKCPSNPLNCPVCGKVMTYMYSLRRHLAIQHAGYIDGIVQKKLKKRENQQQQESNMNNVPVKIYQTEPGGGGPLKPKFYLILSPLLPPEANTLVSNKRILISENDEEQLSLNKLSRVRFGPNLDPETFPILCTFSGCGYRFKTQKQERNHNKIIHKGLRFRCTVSGCTKSGFKYKDGLTKHLQKFHSIELDKETVLKLTPISTIHHNLELEDLDPLGNFSLQSYCNSSDNEPARVNVNTESVQNNEIQDNFFDSLNSTLMIPMEYKPQFTSEFTQNFESVQDEEIQDNFFDFLNSVPVPTVPIKKSNISNRPQFPSEFTQNDVKSVQDEEIQDNFFDFLNSVSTVPLKKSNNKPQFSSESTQKEYVKRYNKKKVYLKGKFFCNEIVDGFKCTKVCREQSDIEPEPSKSLTLPLPSCCSICDRRFSSLEFSKIHHQFHLDSLKCIDSTCQVICSDLAELKSHTSLCPLAMRCKKETKNRHTLSPINCVFTDCTRGFFNDLDFLGHLKIFHEETLQTLFDSGSCPENSESRCLARCQSMGYIKGNCCCGWKRNRHCQRYLWEPAAG